MACNRIYKERVMDYVTADVMAMQYTCKQHVIACNVPCNVCKFLM